MFTVGNDLVSKTIPWRWSLVQPTCCRFISWFRNPVFQPTSSISFIYPLNNVRMWDLTQNGMVPMSFFKTFWVFSNTAILVGGLLVFHLINIFAAQILKLIFPLFFLLVVSSKFDKFCYHENFKEVPVLKSMTLLFQNNLDLPAREQFGCCKM